MISRGWYDYAGAVINPYLRLRFPEKFFRLRFPYLFCFCRQKIKFAFMKQYSTDVVFYSPTGTSRSVALAVAVVLYGNRAYDWRAFL